MKSCMIAGSFDPVTNGHMDLIVRASGIFDRVYAVIFRNSSKKCTFLIETRLKMLKAACAGMPDVTVDMSDGLVVDYAKEHGISCIVKGVRDVSDFTYESNIININRAIAPEIETFLMLSDSKLSYVSSSFVKEMLIYGRDVSEYMPRGSFEIISAHLSDVK